MNRIVKNTAIIVGAVITFIPLFLYLNQKKINDSLLSQQIDLQRKLELGEKAREAIEMFKRKGLGNLKTQKELLAPKIPSNEQSPLIISKQLSRIALDIGIDKISISNKKREKTSTANLYRLPLSVNLECTYQRLCRFLNKISSADRLIVIEEISIEREEDILPRLDVTLELSAYTLLQ